MSRAATITGTPRRDAMVRRDLETVIQARNPAATRRWVSAAARRQLARMKRRP